MTETIPFVLKQKDWPYADQALWSALFTDGDIFDDVGACRHWSDGSRNKRRQGYGQWLSFVLRCEPGAVEMAPTARVSKERVERYLEECRARLQPRSVAGLVIDLYEVARHAAPHDDWNWLRLAARRLDGAASKLSLPETPPISAGQIFQWSTQRLEALAAETSTPTLRKAIRFRQALMIGFLIARPVRRRALLAMRLGQLQRSSTGFVVHFAARDMKDNKQRSVPLPKMLNWAMSAYLMTHRPILLGESISDYLWISQFGAPLTPDGFSKALHRVTERYLGVALRPHVFRSIAATSIAEIDPEHVNIIRDILGHATLAMSQKHYNRASGISSCNMLQSIMEDIHEDVPRMGRAKRDNRSNAGRR